MFEPLNPLKAELDKLSEIDAKSNDANLQKKIKDFVEKCNMKSALACGMRMTCLVACLSCDTVVAGLNWFRDLQGGLSETFNNRATHF